MKILAVGYDSDAPFGASQQFLAILSGLREAHSVDIDVLMPRKSGMVNTELQRRGFRLVPGGLTVGGRRYFNPTTTLRHDGRDSLRKVRALGRHWADAALTAHLAQTLSTDTYDAVYTTTRLPRAGALIARRLGVPHICHVHEDRFPDDSWGFWGNAQLEAASECVIFVSNAMRERFAQVVPSRKLVTIYNGVETGVGAASTFNPNKVGLDLFMGSWLRPGKGHTDALAALSILARRGRDDINLHIVGGAVGYREYLDHLRATISDLGLRSKVVLHGASSDVMAARQGMDCELICSDEAFGRVTVEGMRSGLVIIGSDVGGTPEIVAGGDTGLLYTHGDPYDLAEKIDWVYHNREAARDIAERGHSFAQGNFLVAQNVREVYDQMRVVIERSRA